MRTERERRAALDEAMRRLNTARGHLDQSPGEETVDLYCAAVGDFFEAVVAVAERDMADAKARLATTTLREVAP